MEKHFYHLVKLAFYHSILFGVLSLMLLHVNMREVNFFHLSMKLQIFFLVGIQDNTWLFLLRMRLLRYDFASKTLPVKKLALKLYSFLKIFIKSIIAALLHVVPKISIELENFFTLLASFTQYLLYLILKIFDIEI